jgi:multiple sugar transport system substrate-binding protein
VREALEYVQKLQDIPIIPASYTTMDLAGSHIYFHTEQKACMFIVGAWYTGRAFVPVDKGGQPDDFRLGFLRNPAMPNGKGNDDGIFSMGGAVSVASMSKNLDTAVDIVKFFAQPKYANLWVSTTAIPTGLVTDPATMPETKYKWYFDVYGKYAEKVNWEIFPWVPACGDMADAYHSVFDEGLPLKLITLDKAIETLEAARAACK